MIDKNVIFEKNNNTISKYTFSLENGEDAIVSHLPDNLVRKESLNFCDISENEIVRHYINLSNKNYGVDNNLYPLGSCTMKYNPKINERIARAPSFTDMHPYAHNDRTQGNLDIIYNCKQSLLEITGMDDLTFSPSAGAHGELTGLYIIKAYFEDLNQDRKIVLIPDSAHGTNPASASMAGFACMVIKSDDEGFIDIEDLEEKANNDVAALMLTNPNTIGLFEKDIDKITEICKKYDIQLYYDGANLNAFLGLARPGDMGFDVIHMNLHKTFSTPHGGGGPGAGPVAVKQHLSAFLPDSDVIKEGDTYTLVNRDGKSIGKIRSFYANFLIVLRAYVYICTLGREGMTQSGYMALLNANYLAELLREHFVITTSDHIMHEFVISLTNICKEQHITVMDFAKRILDYNYHAPTVSFPLIVSDCLMVEPTETESKKTLDEFAAVLITILNEAKENPQVLMDAPVNTPVKRPDDVAAARKPIVRYNLNTCCECK